MALLACTLQWRRLPLQREWERVQFVIRKILCSLGTQLGRRLRTVAIAAAILSLVALPPAGSARANNLLFNGSFEDFTGYGTDPIKGAPLKVATGWWRFVEAGNPYFMSTRNYNGSAWGCQCWVDVQDGEDSQFIFSPDNSAYTAGVYQQVGGVTPGVAYAVSGRIASAGDAGVARRIGIDPTGGADSRSPNVVWGNLITSNSSGHYVNLQASAVAQKSTITLFLWISRPAGPPSETFVDAATLDVAPVAHVNPLPEYQAGANVTVSWAIDSVPAGANLTSYDVQAKDGANGAWRDWQVEVTGTAAQFAGVEGHTYYFQVRAMARATVWPGNRLLGVYPGGKGHAQVTVGLPPPVSAVKALPAFQRQLSFAVAWAGAASGTSIASYDIQVRDSAAGAWTDWQTGVGALTAEFKGQDGHTYYFRGRAHGSSGVVEAFREAADTKITVDVQPPTTTILPLSAWLRTATVAVTWIGADASSGIASYEVQTRSVSLGRATDSGWTDWLTTTVLTRTLFTGQDGTIYSFRVRARDGAGNVGAFPVEPVQDATFLLSLETAPEVSVTTASGVLGWAAQVPSYTLAVAPTALPSPTATVLPATPAPEPAPAVKATVETSRRQLPAAQDAGLSDEEEASASAVGGGLDFALAFLALTGSLFVRRWASGRAQRQGRG
jgi:hypothetical protein